MLMTWALLRGIGLEVCDWISTASKTSFLLSFTYYLTVHYTYYVIDLPSLLPDLSATATLKCLV